MIERDMNIHYVAILSDLDEAFLQTFRESVAYYHDRNWMKGTYNWYKKYNTRTGVTTEFMCIKDNGRYDEKTYELSVVIRWHENKRPVIRWTHIVKKKNTSDEIKYHFSSETADLNTYIEWYDTIASLVYKNQSSISFNSSKMLTVLRSNVTKLYDYRKKLNALITTDGDNSGRKSA